MSSTTSPSSSKGLTLFLSAFVALVCLAAAIALTAGLSTGYLVIFRIILCALAPLIGIFIVTSLASRPSSAVTVVVGTLAAFVSFAVIAALLQTFAGGPAADAVRAERVEKKDTILKEQHELLAKYGLEGDATAVFDKSLAQLKGRKEAVSTQVVPGSPTALKAAAAAPAPAPAPAAAPAPGTAPAPAPAPAPATPPPPPAPTTSPPAAK
jgi:hypothetical protein